MKYFTVTDIYMFVVGGYIIIANDRGFVCDTFKRDSDEYKEFLNLFKIDLNLNEGNYKVSLPGFLFEEV